MTKAARTSWKTILPPPARREDLNLTGSYDSEAAEKLKNGLVPQGMDDKWFIFCENDWLFFHRSWTGACIYGLHLVEAPDGLKIDSSWVNRDESQYKLKDVEYDRKLVQFLIDAHLLGKPVAFPKPPNVPKPE